MQWPLGAAPMFFEKASGCNIYDVDNCPDEEIILDAGPKTIRKIMALFKSF